MTTSMPQNAPCPCDSKKSYAVCCEPLHRGAPAPNAEALMRSRYSAFAFGLHAYLHRSWHPTQRPALSEIGHDQTKWVGLRVHRHETIDADHALVEFTARYKINGRAFSLHEVSRFVREQGHWFYVSGQHDVV